MEALRSYESLYEKAKGFSEEVEVEVKEVERKRGEAMRNEQRLRDEENQAAKEQQVVGLQNLQGLTRPDPVANLAGSGTQGLERNLTGSSPEGPSEAVQSDRHVSKAQKADAGTRRPTVLSPDETPGEGSRRSSRSAVVESSSKPRASAPPKKLKKDELPNADFGLVMLLDSGVTGQDSEQHMGVDTLSEKLLAALRKFWDEAKAKEVQGSRFTAWFSGKTFDAKCLACQMWPRSNSSWPHGKGFACDYCVKNRRPCCRVKVGADGRPVQVSVLPEHNKQGEARYRYWTRGD
ncbi:hypothetical protein LTR37_009346 [Vermiconidia calcicola]|uniref:Uncharacterized protein n=1 Tax=Vermiconidia calcicola TaxID=1690605 RepID=A0ACC3N8H7_9PEZI|nr:hypothetical protein LTR37_009346 [Vermiconidia calcicola]